MRAHVNTQNCPPPLSSDPVPLCEGEHVPSGMDDTPTAPTVLEAQASLQFLSLQASFQILKACRGFDIIHLPQFSHDLQGHEGVARTQERTVGGEKMGTPSEVCASQEREATPHNQSHTGQASTSTSATATGIRTFRALGSAIHTSTLMGASTTAQHPASWNSITWKKGQNFFQHVKQ